MVLALNWVRRLLCFTEPCLFHKFLKKKSLKERTFMPLLILSVGRAWELKLRYRKGASQCTSNTPVFPPGEWVEVKIPVMRPLFPRSGEEEVEIDQSSGKLQIGKEGLIFEGGMKEVPLDGGDYRILLDDNCPPLSPKEYEKACDLLVDVLEGNAPMKLIDFKSDKETENKLWTWIASQIGRDGEKDEIVESVQHMVRDGTCSEGGRKKCRKAMQEHPRKPVPSSTISGAEIKKLVEDGRATIVIYHRAVDRFPGGNSDQHVVKHIFNLSSNHGEAIHFLDWDGRSSILEEPVILEKVGDVAKSLLGPKLITLLENSEVGNREFEFTISDMQKDSDEYDTEWSSIEGNSFCHSPPQTDRV